MGNAASHKGGSGKRGRDKKRNEDELAARAQQVMGESVRELQAGIQSGIKRLEEQDHPAAQILDSLCSPYLESNGERAGVGSWNSDDASEEDSRTISEDETTLTDYERSRRRKDRNRHHDERSLETGSYQSQSDGYESSTVVTEDTRQNAKNDVKNQLAQQEQLVKKPLASSFAKRCYFTKQGIGGQTQHYEGLTLTGNVVLMLASAMKLKGCPTICDEDLRRVEQTYPNQFSRLPDELLLSSGWRRISKYCHFSNKPIPDGCPFFRKYK